MHLHNSLKQQPRLPPTCRCHVPWPYINDKHIRIHELIRNITSTVVR
jgi:hypothetical protein